LSNSRVFTCDADNLATINQCIHKHPHELLDSVVKERFDGTEGLNRGRAFYAAHPACQALAERFFVSAQSLTTATRTSRISQREANHTALNHTVNLASTSSPPPLADPSQPNHSSNSLILKEFSAASRCEVGRIIGAPFLPSTAFCSFLTKTVAACFSSLLPRQAHGKSLGQRGDGKTGVDPDVGRNGTAIHHIQPRITKHLMLRRTGAPPRWPWRCRTAPARLSPPGRSAHDVRRAAGSCRRRSAVHCRPAA